MAPRPARRSAHTRLHSAQLCSRSRKSRYHRVSGGGDPYFEVNGCWSLNAVRADEGKGPWKAVSGRGRCVSCHKFLLQLIVCVSSGASPCAAAGPEGVIVRSEGPSAGNSRRDTGSGQNWLSGARGLSGRACFPDCPVTAAGGALDTRPGTQTLSPRRLSSRRTSIW